MSWFGESMVLLGTAAYVATNLAPGILAQLRGRGWHARAVAPLAMVELVVTACVFERWGTVDNDLKTRPGARSGLAMGVSIIPLVCATITMVAPTARSDVWPLFWAAIGAGHIVLANVITSSRPVPENMSTHMLLTVSFAAVATACNGGSSQMIASMHYVLLFSMFQSLLHTFLADLPFSFTVGEAITVSVVAAAVFVNALSITIAKLLPILRISYSFQPLFYPSESISFLFVHCMLAAAGMIVFVLLPLLGGEEVMKDAPIAGSSPVNEECGDLSSELSSASDDHGESEEFIDDGVPIPQTATEFYSRIIIVCVFGIHPWLVLCLGREPLGWIYEFTVQKGSFRVHFVAYWIVAILVAVPLIKIVERRLPQILSRKLYHLLAVFLFVPPSILEPEFTCLAFSIAFFTFIMLECVRSGDVPPYGPILRSFCAPYVDSRDSGHVILTHIYLLTGCAIPVWLHCYELLSEPKEYFPALAGTIILGVGDALASIGGVAIGWIKWPGASKTVEGSLFGFIASLVSIYVIGLLFPRIAYTSIQDFIIPTFLTILLEAFTQQSPMSLGYSAVAYHMYCTNRRIEDPQE